MPTAYNYHPVTGEYTTEFTPDVSPLEPDVPLLPQFSTLQKPPNTNLREKAVFISGKWEVKADWRGITLYSTIDGSLASITDLGKTPTDVGATDKPMPSPACTWQSGKWVPDAVKAAAQAQAAKDAAWERIKGERDRRKESGGYKVGDKWFHSDTGSRIQQLGLVMSGGNMPPNLQWKMMDGSFVHMTPALAQGIFAAATAYDMAVFAAAEAHRIAMEASPDPAAYDFSAGWPKIYGEE